MARVGSVCDGRETICGDFYAAVKSGGMLLDKGRGGWVWTELPKRQMSWQARYYANERGLFTDNTGEPMLLTEICPFCGGELAPVTQHVVGQQEGEGAE